MKRRLEQRIEYLHEELLIANGTHERDKDQKIVESKSPREKQYKCLEIIANQLSVLVEIYNRCVPKQKRKEYLEPVKYANLSKAVLKARIATLSQYMTLNDVKERRTLY
ncbi:MAG TPA: hypothetical protein VJK51_03920 [Candidatus Nanoarchaeia archaeon]|nr:hypothetical protein [Candidatus Nanoarchaeia archaeon]